MASLASGLFKSLPKPKYTGEEEEVPQHAQTRGPRVVGADQLDETQVVLRVSSISIIPFLGRKLTVISNVEDWTSPLWKPRRLATSSPRRFW